jgi:hypothetical protein
VFHRSGLVVFQSALIFRKGPRDVLLKISLEGPFGIVFTIDKKRYQEQTRAVAEKPNLGSTMPALGINMPFMGIHTSATVCRSYKHPIWV